jgi:hypothetical protein
MNKMIRNNIHSQEEQIKVSTSDRFIKFFKLKKNLITKCFKPEQSLVVMNDTPGGQLECTTKSNKNANSFFHSNLIKNMNNKLYMSRKKKALKCSRSGRYSINDNKSSIHPKVAPSTRRLKSLRRNHIIIQMKQDAEFNSTILRSSVKGDCLIYSDKYMLKNIFYGLSDQQECVQNSKQNKLNETYTIKSKATKTERLSISISNTNRKTNKIIHKVHQYNVPLNKYSVKLFTQSQLSSYLSSSNNTTTHKTTYDTLLFDNSQFGKVLSGYGELNMSNYNSFLQN